MNLLEVNFEALTLMDCSILHDIKGVEVIINDGKVQGLVDILSGDEFVILGK